MDNNSNYKKLMKWSDFMINMVQYLEQNPSLVTLLKEKKASLVGVTELEQKAILDSFDEDVCLESTIWY
ncbi:competence protein ComX [Lysinibacillus sphaericus CBAM5]|uniref:ComX pheromone n=4 Tax=Lysinibacillus TaxID=400634 RepID=W7S098_LYSSH|nr:competence protein ComX [Lysinibacillus sphaericus CBAM5]